MSLFNLIIVQPIFNLLLFIYGIIPGSDFGIAIIIFTVLVRLIMWPLVKKQLHQTKLIRQLQPELKKVKAKAKGNKQLEGQLMMELYREKGVSPFGSLGLLIVQLPVFIALFEVIRILTQHHDQIPKFTYGFMNHLPAINAITQDPSHNFNETLLHLVDLTRAATHPTFYLPVFIMAVLAAVFQYIQSKQLAPAPKDGMKLRDALKAQAAGKQVDQAEVTAAMTSKMTIFFPFITFFVAINFPGGLVLYYATQSLVAVFQQRSALREDTEEMEALADKPLLSKNRPTSNVQRLSSTTQSSSSKSKSPTSIVQHQTSTKGASGQTNVRTFTEGSSEDRASKSKSATIRNNKSSK
ncbi:MAG TPA: YidC/Oxa1 family membrane protein insertase, partial [Candidatus Saccharimonadales bacterium]|nr:YidC/Oxa1 family membrane protein insertase [Candidatus Saccharimonadales bacterium]